MFSKKTNFAQTDQNLENFMEDNDIYNSKLLNYLQDYPESNKKKFIITSQQYRPDLIAKEFYGSTDYTAYVIIQCGTNLSGFYKGKTISLIPDDILKLIINTKL